MSKVNIDMTEEELEKLLMKPKILHLGKMFHILITNARYVVHLKVDKGTGPAAVASSGAPSAG